MGKGEFFEGERDAVRRKSGVTARYELAKPLPGKKIAEIHPPISAWT
jgi:hypothetical protein